MVFGIFFENGVNDTISIEFTTRFHLLFTVFYSIISEEPKEIPKHKVKQVCKSQF